MRETSRGNSFVIDSNETSISAESLVWNNFRKEVGDCVPGRMILRQCFR
jgi:hypothetical protein